MEDFGAKNGKFCVRERQFKEASDFGFCRHANAGRSLIKSSRQISSGGISNISPISAFDTIHNKISGGHENFKKKTFPQIFFLRFFGLRFALVFPY